MTVLSIARRLPAVTRRAPVRRLDLMAAFWAHGRGRDRVLMLLAHSSLPAAAHAGVRLGHGVPADLVSLAPSPGGAAIVVRVHPRDLPPMWPVSLRVGDREAVVPAGMTLPPQTFRRGLRRYRSTGAVDPLGRFVVVTERGRGAAT
ncbi:hypothetical protein SRB5_59290 [Streptomyces sp. RB5]|uniref:Uncharacterized protein n=1 Tax=Streptomyces smaragdinus TaxID=2585196 RepID=A0A7K0CQJ6_9ACTN|nr:hypothetical protein [Streptomyces smaragdinus]MQY15739.1 hypothetical protein [Streptomyces smaragdinus]